MDDVKNVKKDIIYGLNARPPFWECLIVAFQHLLGIFVPILTPGLIICGALGLDLATTAYVLNMSLFASGVSTFIQVYKIGPVGSGLLSIQGTSFSFVGPVVAAGKVGGLPLIFGVSIIGSFIEMALSRFVSSARKIITPLVCGIVVMMIGLTLIKSGIVNCAGGVEAQRAGEFGSFRNLGLSALVLFTIIAFNRSSNKYLRMSSIFIGLASGYVVSACIGLINFSGLKALDMIAVPIPFKYGLSFDWAAFISIGMIYFITTIETIGDLTATSAISREPIEGEIYMKRLAGGVLGDAVNSLIAAAFNSFPNTTFSQNNGIIQLTGVASRAVGYHVAALLTILGIFPIIGGVFSIMPPAVLGGATILMFGTVAANGIKIISGVEFGRRTVTILAISLGLGLGVTFSPEILEKFPPILKEIFGSGITTGGISAFLANLLIPEEAVEE